MGAHYELGLVELKRNRLVVAEPAFRRAVGLRPLLGKAYYNLGKIYTRLGANDQAKNAFQRFREISKQQEALEQREALASINPDVPQVLLHLATTYVHQGKLLQ